MKFTLSEKITKCDLLLIPLYAGKNGSDFVKENSPSDFEGKPNERILMYQKDKIVPRILLIGLGKEKEENLEQWRQAGATVAKEMKKNIHQLCLLPPKEEVECIGAFLEGMRLAHDQYEAFISKEDRKLSPIESIQVVMEDRSKHKAMGDKWNEVFVITEAVKQVRHKVNAPSNAMSPTLMAKAAQKIAKQSRRISCTVIGEKKLTKMGMGCLVGVGKGAYEETQMIVLEYKNKPTNKKPIVLIGKGICFDSGGINLKTRDLVQMKYDMTGAAIILGIFDILSKLDLPLHVVGLAPCAENLIGERATKPGDILTAYDGTTVEVTNTDAEGRLILCDAISYALDKYKPEAIVDVATLTGGAVVALGHDISALLSNNEPLAQQMKQAATATQEKVWELPLEPAYKKALESTVADMRNFSEEASASTIMGALFLNHFVKDTPWVHIDMGGTGWINTPKSYYPKGASGKMVRTFWEFLKAYNK